MDLVSQTIPPSFRLRIDYVNTLSLWSMERGGGKIDRMIVPSAVVLLSFISGYKNQKTNEATYHKNFGKNTIDKYRLSFFENNSYNKSLSHNFGIPNIYIS